VAVIKIRPALYKIEGQPWAWVLLSELAETLGIDAREVWERFFSLSKDVDILAICDGAEFWNVGEEGEIERSFDGQSWRYAFGSEENFKRKLQEGAFYVPAGWAKEVARAWESGAWRRHDQEDEPDNRPLDPIWWQLTHSGWD
jgi:hypothetical protein